MSGSMRYDGQYINVKRMGLALEGLDSQRVSGRLAAVHRSVFVREAGRAGADCELDAEAGDAVRSGRCSCGPT